MTCSPRIIDLQDDTFERQVVLGLTVLVSIETGLAATDRDEAANSVTNIRMAQSWPLEGSDLAKEIRRSGCAL